MAKFEPKEAVNFKKLYRKNYGDIVKMHDHDKLTPEQLFDMAVSYFEWAEQNHLKAAETASFQGHISEGKVHKARVFTVTGLRLFCAISENRLNAYRNRDGYREVMEFIDSVIYEQKYQLAVTGIINANLIAKDLGIDKNAQVNVTATATSGEAVTKEDIGEAVKSILEDL